MDMHLCRRRKVPVNVIDLFLEALIQHFVSLIQNQDFDASGSQRSSLDHIKDAPGGS